LPGGPENPPHGGGGGGPSTNSNRPVQHTRSCFEEQYRANQKNVNDFLGKPLAAMSTQFGKMLVGAGANRITNTTGTLRLLLGNAQSAPAMELWSPLQPSPGLAGTLWGTELSGGRVLAILGYNYLQGVAIMGTFKLGTMIGSAAVALDTCRK
jgi:hypothetical protein